MADGSWQQKLASLIQECQRLLKPHGHLLIIDTANLFNELPFGEVFHPIRKMFLSYLEEQHQFQKAFYKNDWDLIQLKNVKWAKFWFGAEITQMLIDKNKTIIEECAGIWWRKFS